MAAKRNERVRLWTFLVYPESAPEDWRTVLDDLHIEWVESPLHEHDVNPDGTKKKPHWHILLSFDGVKTYEQVCDITSSLHATIPQKVQSAKGLVRYMAHLDNPEKYQYDISLIIGHGGADVGTLLKPTAAARYVLIKEMSEFILDNDIIYFKDLYFYAMAHRFDDWYPLLCDSSAYILGNVIRSCRDAYKDFRADQKEEREAKEISSKPSGGAPDES